MDLFAIAAGNAVALAQAYEALVAGLPEGDAGAVTGFAERVGRDGRVAINMRLSVLAGFLEQGRHLNVYEWATTEAAMTGADRDGVLRAKLGRFYGRRIAFDAGFKRGDEFRYGALNIGGCGVCYYGEFCSVYGADFPAASEVAYLRGDSLREYVSADAKVDEAAVRRDVAPHDRRQCLAAMKHSAEVLSTEQSRWPDLLCASSGRDPDFVEAIFVGEATCTRLQAVRMPQSEHDRYFTDLFEESRGALSAARGSLLDTFIRVKEHLDALGVPLEVIADA